MATKILIIDDEIGICETLADYLEDDIDIILTANNGLEALKVYEKEKPFDCIICDINMPIMNGVEFIKAIREKNDNTNFIFFTGHGTRELMSEAVKYGAFDFIYKPSFDNLFETINAAIDHKHETNTQNSEKILSEYKKILNISKE